MHKRVTKSENLRVTRICLAGKEQGERNTSGTQTNIVFSYNFCPVDTVKWAAVQDVQMYGHTLLESLAWALKLKKQTILQLTLNMCKSEDREKKGAFTLGGTFLRVSNSNYQMSFLFWFVFNICIQMSRPRKKLEAHNIKVLCVCVFFFFSS